MKNDLSTDYFDCPHCGIKNVIYKKESTEHEEVKYDTDSYYRWVHYIVKCTRESCGRLTYFRIKEQEIKPGRGWHEVDSKEVEIQYPSDNSELPDYIPENIRKHYKEAVDACSFGLKSAASVMCRKVVYEICDIQGVEGRDYKEKIHNLGFDKRITDPLLNIKNIGDETVHAKGWDIETIQKAIDALGIIIDMMYTQENRIKAFSKQYTAKNQSRKSESIE